MLHQQVHYNVALWLQQRAKTHGAKTAVVELDSNRKVSYAELNEHSSCLAAGLSRLGLRKGDRLAVLMENRVELLELFYACSKLGVVFTPLSFRWTSKELSTTIKHCSPKSLVAEEELLKGKEEALKEVSCVYSLGEGVLGYQSYEELLSTGTGEALAKVNPEDVQTLMYTAGTTGSPKGCLLPYRKTLHNVLNAQLTFGLNEADVALCTLPLFHSGGLFIQAVPTLCTGGTLLLLRRVRGDPHRLLEALEKGKATWFLGVAFHAKLLAGLEKAEDTYRLEAMRFWAFGGEAIPYDVVEKLQVKWPHIALSFCYGTTETSLSIALPPSKRRVSSYLLAKSTRRAPAGKPMPHCEVKISEEGEILVKGPIVFLGYHENPEATAKAFDEDGWYHTGDLAIMDEEGYIYVVDRLYNVIKSGGEKILATEVEEVLLSHPAIADAAVVGVPDEKWGERPIAFVVLKPGFEEEPEQLKAFCASRLAKFKVPDKIIFVEELPRAGPDKVARGGLRKLVLGD